MCVDQLLWNIPTASAQVFAGGVSELKKEKLFPTLSRETNSSAHPAQRLRSHLNGHTAIFMFSTDFTDTRSKSKAL